ncbi:type I restriction enzyme HsdR N-terminal domain-containing protein [Marinigracilibium pacificum]|uniref:Type I restriction enzyme HsdR N-terminal domain-containing protein n=1 Tax=Marinigracilibium pacificum TaxID=2729599 RepID=A0A848J887_9BACT|nr:type I restriction enzyme HsdR N-terminal domain-containing protein [Marinigracilibium pacificum]NMM50700.1 type I restriction enzyme HsdR N-terminal domain-containing protein [Marinigracilibium pacificum]
MNKLNLPEYNIKTKRESGKEFIWDIVRKKFLVLTPEEYVRQSFIRYLIHDMDYPASLINIEGGLMVNVRQKRSDIIIYKGSDPFMLVECKASDVKIDRTVFEQAVMYNHTIRAKYLMLTNGLVHLCFKQEGGHYEPFGGFPKYK